jgi:AcrR family transcriptional regulator
MHAKKVNASAMRSRQSISDALVEMMKTKTFQDITVTDICEIAGLVRKTFYRNFRSKDDVIIYIIENVFKEFITARNIKLMTTYDVLWDVYKFIDTYREFLILFYKNNLLRFVNKNVADFIVKEQVLFNELNLSEIDEKCLRYIPPQLSALVVSIVETWIEGGFVETPQELAALTESILHGKLYR